MLREPLSDSRLPSLPCLPCPAPGGGPGHTAVLLQPTGAGSSDAKGAARVLPQERRVGAFPSLPGNFMFVMRSVKLIMSINSFFGGDYLRMNALLHIADLVADGVEARIF